MPTRDRRPRRRIKANERASDLPSVELLQMAKYANSEHWENGLRRDLIRAFIQDGQKEEIAIRMARAFEKRPEFIPNGRPRADQSQSMKQTLLEVYGG